MATITDVFGPPPPGIDLSENRTPKNNAVMIAMYILAFVAIILRFVSRMRVQRIPVEIDDWVIAACLIPLTGLLVSSLIAGKYGLGKHVWSVSLDDVVNMRKVRHSIRSGRWLTVKDLFAYIFVYLPVLSCVKIGILLLYRRIFGMTWMMWLCFFCSVGFVVGTIIAFLCAPRPLSYFWNQFVDPTGGSYAYDLYKFYLGNASANVTIDLMVLLVPVPIVWRLQLKTVRKILVCSIFLLGVFVTVASVVRIYYLTFLNTEPDVTWIMGDVFVWSTIEPAVGILCACLPTLNPILQLVVRTLFGTATARLFGSSYRTNSKPHRSGIQNKRHSFRQLGEDGTFGTKVTGRSEDEIMLTTNAKDEEESYSRDAPFAITVKQDFHWSEERP